MSPVTIRAAIEALDERKIAAGANEPYVEAQFADAADGAIDARLIVAGLDVDANDLGREATEVAIAILSGSVGINPLVVVRSAWIDGLLTGLVRAELTRQAAGPSSRAEHPPPVIDPRVAASDDVVNALRKATAAELRTHVIGGKLNVLAATDGIVDVVLDELVRQGHR